ncbi:MAG: hypothetical protein AB8B65_05305 [Kordia sp.]|uniref:hypothetical protein n=1 Tax=Kordia sp. TaxID=1965332 RepID=UPI00385C5754
MKKEDQERISTELLDTLVVLEKLKLKPKSLFKQASLLGFAAIIIIGLGAYGSVSEWTDFPILQAAIAAGGILLALAFRPIQKHKKEIDLTRKKQRTLEALLKEDNLEYKADVQVSLDSKGKYVVKKNIKLITIK